MALAVVMSVRVLPAVADGQRSVEVLEVSGLVRLPSWFAASAFWLAIDDGDADYDHW